MLATFPTQLEDIVEEKISTVKLYKKTSEYIMDCLTRTATGTPQSRVPRITGLGTRAAGLGLGLRNPRLRRNPACLLRGKKPL